MKLSYLKLTRLFCLGTLLSVFVILISALNCRAQTVPTPVPGPGTNKGTQLMPPEPPGAVAASAKPSGLDQCASKELFCHPLEASPHANILDAFSLSHVLLARASSR